MRVALLFAIGCGRIAFDPIGGDGASPDRPPINTNIAFVTGPDLTPGAFGGLAGADAACQSIAAQAGLPGTYVAYLSTSTMNAIDRLNGARGWTRPDGTPLADTPADIASGRLFATPIVDANGGRPPSVNGPIEVVTGSSPSGTIVLGAMCADYTSGTSQGQAGTATASSSLFSTLYTTTCGSGQRIYCFGIDKDTPVAPPIATASDRRAFLSSSWLSGGGLTSADAHCQADAAAAGMSGTFHALLATTTASAASRFSTSGSPWMRVDGVRIAATATDLLTDTRFVLEPLDVTATGQYLPRSSPQVWTGAPDVYATAGSASCNDWTSSMPGQSGSLGVPDLIGPYWFNAVLGGQPSQACDQLGRLYCLEP